MITVSADRVFPVRQPVTPPDIPMDYLKYWSLFDRPFQHPATDRRYCGASEREVITSIHRLAAEDQAALPVAEPRHEVGDVLHRLAIALGLVAETSAQPPPERIQQRITTALEASRRQSIKLIWLIDDCTLPAARVAGTLAGQGSEFAAIAVSGHQGSDQLGRLLSRTATAVVPLQMKLNPLTFQETIEYVRTSLKQVGGRCDTWSDSAIIRLYELGRGKLKAMSRLAEASMRLAAQHGMESVGQAMVDGAIAEFADHSSSRAA